jgi:hypothetical protein
MRRPVSALEAVVVALEPIVEETWPLPMKLPVLVLKDAVVTLEPIVEKIWPMAVLEAAVAALEPVVEEIESVGMQPCLPLHCHRPQHYDQVVN